MKLLRLWKSLLAATLVIGLIFLLISFMDVAIAFFYPRFSTPASFIVTFGVGGIFASVFGYFNGIQLAPEKNELARWVLVLGMLGLGLLFFFLLARIEGGEYEAAFKSFGATMGFGSLLFVSGKVQV
jgi:hypothetical protein